MTKAEIVAEISKMTGVEREKSLKVVEALMTIVKDQTAGGEDIFLRGFGTFTTKTRAAKVGRLIKENKSVSNLARTTRTCSNSKEQTIMMEALLIPSGASIHFAY